LRRPPGAEAGRQIAGETERQQSRGESEQCFHKRQLTGRPSASVPDPDLATDAASLARRAYEAGPSAALG
jgi:hypothetical protein